MNKASLIVVFSVIDVPCGNVAGLCGNELCWASIPGFGPLAVIMNFIMATASVRNISFEEWNV